jgi:hypothetical protein
MQFDPSFDPTAGDSKLSPATAATMRATRDHWRKLGLSVQFVDDSGALTEWSFRTAVARDAFVAKNLSDKPHAISAAV